MCEILTIAGLFERENSFFFFKNYFVFLICTVSHVAILGVSGHRRLGYMVVIVQDTIIVRVKNIQFSSNFRCLQLKKAVDRGQHLENDFTATVPVPKS